MLKKLTLTLFGLVFALALIAPPNATAEVHVGVQFGGPSYGYVVQQRPYYVYDAPYVVYAPSREYGYRDGYYDRGYRRYDDREYRGRGDWEHHDRGHGNWEHHDRGEHGHGEHHGGDD